MRWRFLWRRVVIGPRRPALCRHHPEPRGSGGGHAEVVPGSTLLQRRRAAPGLRAPLQLLRACLQPDLVTLELSGAVTIMCHQDGDVVVYSAATRGDRV
ncbi:uncharacterized protein LOC107049794 [Gallus gallus]|uniref:uncharacterized protein LOC107049794 n=1 Tax=Gallus gallus TaxID=9031 RepID=UPI001F002407|nr:uncharacterized protein LOC107049794 [Gallus gallus]